jgi:hypothetical protein
VARLVKRLEQDEILHNPPVVIAADDHYVVFDGATRTTALKQLGYPHAVVQVVSDEDKLNLQTWIHAIRGTEPAKLTKSLNSLPEVSLIEADPHKVLDEMFEYGSLCYVHTNEGKVYLIQPVPLVNQLDALNKLTKTYIEAYTVDRVLDKDITRVQQEYPDLVGLVVFPTYTVEQVLQIARVGHVLPAGITRFIIPGRVLGLNVALSELMADKSLEEKNKWLYQLLKDKQVGGKVRYYEEPVYVLDE